VKIQNSRGKTNFFFGALHFSPWGNFSHMVAYRSSSKNIGKMNLQSILNKNSPWTHLESKFDVLNVAKKLLKYVVHLFKRIYLKKNSLLTWCPNSK
jgi:hypothetical protein